MTGRDILRELGRGRERGRRPPSRRDVRASGRRSFAACSRMSHGLCHIVLAATGDRPHGLASGQPSGWALPKHHLAGLLRRTRGRRDVEVCDRPRLRACAFDQKSQDGFAVAALQFVEPTQKKRGLGRTCVHLCV